MRRGTVLFIVVFLGLATTLPVYATGVTFTNLAENQSSGLADADFSAGTAMFDYNNDGYDDIVVNNYFTPNRLYMSHGNGTFTDVAEQAGVIRGPHTLGIATADLDASGYMDFLVFCENYNPGFLYMNNGNGTFTDLAVPQFSIAGGYDGYAAAFADIDNDGILEVVYAGRLFRNTGNFTFVDITASAGLTGWHPLAEAAFGDIDNDGDLDLLCSREAYMTVCLYENNGQGHFTDISNRIEGLATAGHAVGVSFADVNNDGYLDFFSTYNNIMYLNDGNGNFVVNRQVNIESAYTRGSIFADFDNDGDPDLVLANANRNAQYFENLGNGDFAEKTNDVGLGDDLGRAGGASFGDIDNDGDLDFYVAKTDYTINPMFRNNLDNNNSIEITPRGVYSNYSGIGSRVYVYPSGHLGDPNYQIAMAELTSVTGFSAGANGRFHIGTKDPGLFDVRVVFPSRRVVDQVNVASGSRLTIFESGDVPNYLYVIPGSIYAEQDTDAGLDTVLISIRDSKSQSVNWSAATDVNWITVAPSSSNTPDTLMVIIDPTGFAVGEHQGNITVTAADVINSPFVIHVSWTSIHRLLEQKSLAVGLGVTEFSGGAAFFDYDMDGFDDIFINNVSGSCKLYRSDGHAFADVTSAAGVGGPAYHNLGVFAGDLNADSWPDILSFTEARTVGFTYINSGFSTFIDAAISDFSTALGYDGYATNAADIDNDGDLDVFYGGRLYRDDGNLHFTDITTISGLANIRFVCHATFGDLDNDGDMDMIINRQNLASTLMYRNDGSGHFTDISSNSSVGILPTGLGVSLGDVDNDGDLDFYMGAGYSDPNYLFLNDGSGYFVDATQNAGLSNHNYTRGTDLFDVDNDGDLDLVVANENRSAQLYVNDGTGHFLDVTDMSGINDNKAKAGPAVVGDYDGDGDLDIYIARTDYVGNSFYENKAVHGQYITVLPIGTISNRAGIGTKAYLYPAGQLGNNQALFAYRQLNISNGFNASDAGRIHFGTGSAQLFDLRLVFPSGIVVDRTNITPGSTLAITEAGVVPDYLNLIPGGLTANFQEGDTAIVRTMIVSNSAGNPMAWTATVGNSWCRLNKYSGTTLDTVLVTFDPTGKAAGTYRTDITVTAPGAINSPRVATATMVITSNQPRLALSTTTLNFSTTQNGFNPWPQSFSITNAGQGTLNWTLMLPSVSWLTASPASGTAPSNVTVQCTTAGLEAGPHSAIITIVSPGSINSPTYLTVNFNVLPGQAPETDTVRVASATAKPGDKIVVPVYLHNKQEIAALAVPLKFDPAVMTCDSVSFQGTRVEYLNVKEANIKNDQGQVLIGAIVFMESFIPKGDGLIANMYMTISPSAPDQVAKIDTAFFYPSGDLALYLPNSGEVVPSFVYGNIFISLNMHGDADGNGLINVGDCVYLLNYVFKGQRPPIPGQAGDANTDTHTNVGDVVYIINYVFKMGPPPNGKAKVSTGSVYYTFEKGPGDLIQLRLDADVPLGGLQFDLVDPLNFMTLTDPQTGDLVEHMSVYQGNTGRGHRYGLLDLEGEGGIRAGSGVALKIGYKGPETITTEAVSFFDESGNELPATYGERDKSEALPTSFELSQNYPNPFNPTTTIKYALAKQAKVELVVFNVLGQKVRELVNETQKPGYHSIVWDGADNLGDKVATGIYFYRLKAGEFTQSRKMALIK